MSQSDDFESQQLSLIVPSKQQQLYSIKKYLPQANQLLDKILFCHYQVTSIFPTPFTKLPGYVKYDQAHTDPNNMNSIYQSAFQHQKLKKDVLSLLMNIHHDPLKQKLLKIKLPSLKEYYENKQLVYEKYPCNQKEMYIGTYLFQPQGIKNQQKTRSKSSNGYMYRSTQSSHNIHSARVRIQFSSSFCSGNLFRAYQTNYNQFDLLLQNDINTKGNNQWFFFSVRNVPKNTTLKFNIVNLTKKNSLFRDGMKPAIFSQHRYHKRNIGWVRQGSKINYTNNQKFIQSEHSNRCYSQLSFEYKFIYEGDIVYFSHAIPYTISDLTQFVGNHIKEKKNSKFIRLKNLGRTLGNQELDVIQITNQEYRAGARKKKSVWIIARQHPGEVTSSFMMEGIVNKLLDHSSQSLALLKNYVFKIVPMVNIDGVAHGNSRAELSGCDPNRKWINPHKIRNPIIYALKKAIQKDKSTKGVQMFLDLHSHSRKLGTFFYGNSFLNNKLSTRSYPMMVCQKDTRFSYQNCRFSPCNPSSARQVLFESLKIPLVYTVQSSFYGYQKDNNHQIYQYLPKDYQQMGTQLMTSFYEHSCSRYKNFLAFQSYAEQKQLELQEEHQINEVEEELECRRLKNQEVDGNAGSDSDPSGDEFAEKQLVSIMPGLFGKKKKKQKKSNISKKRQKTKKDQVLLTTPIKTKKNDKQSHYRIYFSAKASNLNKKMFKDDEYAPKQCSDMAVQVFIQSPNILKTCSNNRSSRLFEKRSNLCILGQKMQEQVVVYGNTIGIQAQLKTITKNKEQMRSSIPRKSFKVTTNSRGSTALQTKQNNFLNKADCHYLAATFNFLNCRR